MPPNYSSTARRFGAAVITSAAIQHMLAAELLTAISTTGKEQVLYAFGSGNETSPTAGLLEMNGTLYGTTIKGGSNGWGVVFSLSLSGGEPVLRFGGASDGANPSGELIDVNGRLYGTTAYGGSTSACKQNNGCGTVFALTRRTAASSRPNA